MDSSKMVDLGGYVIILVETHDKKVKLYGSPADKADLEVADEILEINGASLAQSTHTDVIAHIHNCIKSRTICLRVKRRTGNKLAKELAENSHVQDAFVIAVEQQAKERLERLSALRKIKPVDMTKLSQELCEESPEKDEKNTIYSAPVSELGSTTNLNKTNNNQLTGKESQQKESPLSKNTQNQNQLQEEEGESDGGLCDYVTDEELELCQTIQPSTSKTSLSKMSASNDKLSKIDGKSSTDEFDASKSGVASTISDGGGIDIVDTDNLEGHPPTSTNTETSPHKEVLIGGDNNPSRRSSKGSARNFFNGFGNGNVKNGKTSSNNSQNETSANDKPILIEEDTLEASLPVKSHKPLTQTLSLKAIIAPDEMLLCLQRLKLTGDKLVDPEQINSVEQLIQSTGFQRLLRIHNIVQSVQCFQCPPHALCCDTRALVQECMESLQSSPLPESAEILDILNRIEFEGLFFSHDKLAERQAALPWEQCVAEMWTKERPCTPGSIEGKISTAGTASPLSLGDPTASNSKSEFFGEDAILQTGSNTKVVKILKQNEPLGATVRNEGDRVVIGRVVKGGAAERSGQLFPGDEVLEVNGLKVKGKSVHDICDTLCQMTGTLTFVIVPGPGAQSGATASAAVTGAASAPANAAAAAKDPARDEVPETVYHYRAHFSYHPDDDLYIPCHELGISFQRGDILHVINREDPHWWQAYRDGEWTQTLAGLIPSLALQQHRMALQRQKRDQDLRDEREQERTKSPNKKKSSAASSLLCAKKSNKRKRFNSPLKRAQRFDIPPYEEMALYYPQSNQKRPLILVGPPSIGRHELRQSLLEDTTRFAAAVPHTSRSKGEGEIDGQDYNFVNRTQFEEYVSKGHFVEHGEYEKSYYGTSLDSIRTVINSGKICVLNLQAASLKILHESDLKPYVVFLAPPSLQTYKQQKAKYGEQFREDEYRDSVTVAQDMEDNYGHYFESVIPFDDVDSVYRQLMFEINLLEREPQWVPASWVKDKTSH